MKLNTVYIMPTDILEEKKPIVNNSPEIAEEITAPVESTEVVSDEGAEEVIADAVDGEAEGDTPSDPIATQLPNVEITEANRVELQDLIDRAEYGDRSRENNQKIAAILQSDPDLPAIFMDISKGATFQEAIARRIDVSAIAPVEGDPDYEKWGAATKERMANLESSKKRKSTLAENEAKSKETLKKFVTDKEMDDENADKFFGYVSEVLTQAFDGLLSYDLLGRMYTSMTHESEVENAKTIGEINGRNTKIADLGDKEKKKVGDGLPNMVGGGENEKPVKKSQLPTPREQFRV